MTKTLLFAPETLNLAEVTRMLEIAKVARQDFRCIFLSYDGTRRNHRYIAEEGFEIRELEPQFDDAAIRRLYAIDRGDEVGNLFTKEVLRQRIESERALYADIAPVAVLTGFCMSIPISARVAGIPLVWVTQTTWLIEHVKSVSTWPDVLDYPALRWIPAPWLDSLTRLTSNLSFSLMFGIFNRMAKSYGVGPFPALSYFEGDHTLFAEPDNFTVTPIPQRLNGKAHYIGPLFGRLNVPTPPEIRDLPRDKPIIYFAMGSSGAEATVIDVMQAFAGKPWNVIAPIGPLVRKFDAPVPTNVIVTDYIAAHEVNPMADISVIHGGIGTVMTACYSGTPIVGIPNGNPEQEWNLDAIVRKGFAIRLRKKRVSAAQVAEAVETLLSDQQARRKAREFQAVIRSWDGPQNAAAFLKQTFD